MVIRFLHSSILAWRIPWTEEPGGLQSVGSQRVGLDRATNTHTQSPLSSKGSHTWGASVGKLSEAGVHWLVGSSTEKPPSVLLPFSAGTGQPLTP